MTAEELQRTMQYNINEAWTRILMDVEAVRESSADTKVILKSMFTLGFARGAAWAKPNLNEKIIVS